MIVPRKIEKDKGLLAKYAGIPLVEVKWMPLRTRPHPTGYNESPCLISSLLPPINPFLTVTNSVQTITRGKGIYILRYI